MFLEFSDKFHGLEAGELSVLDQDTSKGFGGDPNFGLLDHPLKFEDTLWIE
jgi:hypothetical protein